MSQKKKQSKIYDLSPIWQKSAPGRYFLGTDKDPNYGAEVPDYALPLARGPINLKDFLNKKDAQSIVDEKLLEIELETRFDALVALYGGETYSEAWRELAINLALSYVPAFRVEVTSKRHKQNNYFFYFIAMNELVEKHKRTVKAAAVEVHKKQVLKRGDKMGPKYLEQKYPAWKKNPPKLFYQPGDSEYQAVERLLQDISRRKKGKCQV